MAAPAATAHTVAPPAAAACDVAVLLPPFLLRTQPSLPCDAHNSAAASLVVVSVLPQSLLLQLLVLWSLLPHPLMYVAVLSCCFAGAAFMPVLLLPSCWHHSYHFCCQHGRLCHARPSVVVLPGLLMPLLLPMQPSLPCGAFDSAVAAACTAIAPVAAACATALM